MGVDCTLLFVMELPGEPPFERLSVISEIRLPRRGELWERLKALKNCPIEGLTRDQLGYVEDEPESRKLTHDPYGQRLNRYQPDVIATVLREFAATEQHSRQKTGFEAVAALCEVAGWDDGLTNCIVLWWH